jgi:hypothetical protein
MKKYSNYLLLLILCLIFNGTSLLSIELGSPFCDNAILQRNMTVPVWGWAKPKTSVTVEFAGQKVTAVAGADGKWMAKLKPLKTNVKPQEMVVRYSDGSKKTVKNILVGEVWIASGQSNMTWPVGKCNVTMLVDEILGSGKGKGGTKGKGEKTQNSKAEAVPIRQFRVGSAFSAPHPITHATGQWKTGPKYKDFAGIPFSFAYTLYKELKVPIGILNCGQSSTKIQTWITPEGLEGATDAYTKWQLKKVKESQYGTPEYKSAMAAYRKEIAAWVASSKKEVKKKLKPVFSPPKMFGNITGERDISWMHNGKTASTIPYAIRGFIWNQGYANSGDGFVYYYNLHALIRGWRKLWGNEKLPVYFNQFYTPKNKSKAVDELDDGKVLNSKGEMRMGTSAARNIPYTGMASQIDIGGAVHYGNKIIPGKRLALHALKNEYGKKVVADGPFFKSYSTDGDKLIVKLDNAKGGLVVGRTSEIATKKEKKDKPDKKEKKDKKGKKGKKGPKGPTYKAKKIAIPEIIPNGDAQVKIFFITDESGDWKQAKMKIDGERIILTAPGVKKPCGVAYAVNGVGLAPNIYNKAMLPLSPFVYFKNKLQTTKWEMPNDGKSRGPITKRSVLLESKPYKFDKKHLLASHLQENAVIQANMPVTFSGAAPVGATVTVSFGGTKKTVKVVKGSTGWKATMPAFKASKEPRVIKATCSLNGKVIAEASAKNVLVGEVWYVIMPETLNIPKGKSMNSDSKNELRIFTVSGKKNQPRFSFEKNPYHMPGASWHTSGLKGKVATFSKFFGNKIIEKSGSPVGLIVFDIKTKEISVSSFLDYETLKESSSLKEERANLHSILANNKHFEEEAQNYLKRIEDFAKVTMPEIKRSGKMPEGDYNVFYRKFAQPLSQATMSHNFLIAPFPSCTVRGVLFFTPRGFALKEKGKYFGPEFSVLANSMKKNFGGDPWFIYGLPGKSLMPKRTKLTGIKGKSAAIPMDSWFAPQNSDDWLLTEQEQEKQEELQTVLVPEFIDMTINKVYK